MPHREISIQEAHELWQAREGRRMVVLDVRTPEEFTGPCGHLKDAILIPIQEFAMRWRELEAYREQPILAICYSGVRSRQVCAFLDRQGFKELYNAPGMMFWHDAGYEVVPGEPTDEMPDC